MKATKWVWGGFAGILVLLNGCASFPETLKSAPADALLASLSLEADIPTAEGPDRAPILLGDKDAWNKPLEEGVLVWGDVIEAGWSLLYPGSMRWKNDPSMTAVYEDLARPIVPDSIFGFGKPEAVRYATPSGWYHVSTHDVKTRTALAQAWGTQHLWSLRAQAFFLDEGERPDDHVYSLGLRVWVTLFGSDGEDLAHWEVVTKSKAHTFSGWKAARRELPVTLREAAAGFIEKWKTLAFDPERR